MKRVVWLLADRDQSGQILAVGDGRVGPVAQFIDVACLPPEIVLGIPESVLRAHPDHSYVFGQLGRLRDDSWIYCLSRRAGVDVAGRTVCVTRLQIVDRPNETSRPELIELLEIPQPDREFGNEICSLLADPAHPNAKAIDRMLVTGAGGQFTSLASAPVPLAANEHEWKPGKKKFGARSWS